MSHQHQRNLLNEGLRPGDLIHMVDDRITIDQYKSKMGRDEDIAVIAFRVVDKFPAVDLMEFIEKGFPNILDADMSTGEESTGDYAVFVEIERNAKLPEEIIELLQGVSRLTGIETWRFKFFKDVLSVDVTTENLRNSIPLTPDEYIARVKSQAKSEITDILDKGATSVEDIDENSNVTLSRPFAAPLSIHVETIGPFDEIKHTVKGGLQLDESSRGQVSFLEKYLGNYEIHKIDNKFLLRNGNKGLVFTKKDW